MCNGKTKALMKLNLLPFFHAHPHQTRPNSSSKSVTLLKSHKSHLLKSHKPNSSSSSSLVNRLHFFNTQTKLNHHGHLLKSTNQTRFLCKKINFFQQTHDNLLVKYFTFLKIIMQKHHRHYFYKFFFLRRKGQGYLSRLLYDFHPFLDPWFHFKLIAVKNFLLSSDLHQSLSA